MQRKRSIWKNCISLLLLAVSAVFAQPEKQFPLANKQLIQLTNTPPTIQIIQPQNTDSFEWNTLVRYSIRVSDKEDGESEYQEITPTEVLLQVLYLPDKAQADEYIRSGKLSTEDDPGLALIRTSDCFNCHAVRDKLTGPPFSEIAKRYPHNPATVSLLATRIMQGNSGVWGRAAMPPHPDFSQEQAEQIVAWILENTQDPDRRYYVGTEGSFRTRSKPEDEGAGVYLLSASYTDHGTKADGSQRLQSNHTILLRSDKH